MIRRTAKVGDWVVGITPKGEGSRLRYAMCVGEVLSFAEYWQDPRFRIKRPRRGRRASTVERRGDNCYKPLPGGRFEQLPSCHWDSENGRENPATMATDLRGENVLVAKQFCYFGRDAVDLPRPPGIRDSAPGPSRELVGRRAPEARGLPQYSIAWPAWSACCVAGRSRDRIEAAMRLILSRKGFDSSFGGCPSPIFSDGSMVSLPIPEKSSPIRFCDLEWRGRNLGELVSALSRGKQRPEFRAHLDPDLRPESLQRLSGWRPSLGQINAAQGHLRKQGVQPGDLFVFWGLFRQVDEELRWVGRPKHVIWGWMQVGRIASVDREIRTDKEGWSWLGDHPHLKFPASKTNTLYVASDQLTLPESSHTDAPPAGTFDIYAPERCLTADDAAGPSLWSLPIGFLPSWSSAVDLPRQGRSAGPRTEIERFSRRWGVARSSYSISSTTPSSCRGSFSSSTMASAVRQTTIPLTVISLLDACRLELREAACWRQHESRERAMRSTER